MKYYEDKRYHFFELFNEKNGTLIRSNIFGTEKDADMRSFPELIDIGIMGQCESAKFGICKSAGVDCYQSAINSKKKNMSLKNYENILEQSKGRVFQVALGGAGDPNKHEFFQQILEISHKYGVIPNLTTSGFNLTEEEILNIKKYCGAVAVSYYSRLNENGQEKNMMTLDAINKFVSYGCKTNIHYIISNDTIDEAIYRLENEIWPTGIDSIIFILYKPVGLGMTDKKLKNDKKLSVFLNNAINKKHVYNVGFDTCFTSALTNYCDELDMRSVDACEAARFSMYIDSEMNAYPCSFDNQLGKYRVSLLDFEIEEAWYSIEFEQFRNIQKDKCNKCMNKYLCNNGCKLDIDIDLCK